MGKPKISRRQAYIFRPLFELFNEGGLDIEPPSRKRWHGLKYKLYQIAFKLHAREAKRLRAKHGNTTYRGRHGLGGLI